MYLFFRNEIACPLLVKFSDYFVKFLKFSEFLKEKMNKIQIKYKFVFDIKKF